jgi:hypothetical protein
MKQNGFKIMALVLCLQPGNLFAVNLRGDHHALSCASAFLEEMLPQAAEGNIGGLVGWLTDMPELLRDRETLPEVSIRKILWSLKTTLQNQFLTNAVIRNIALIEELRDTEQKSTLLCILDGDCQLQDDYSVRLLHASDVFTLSPPQSESRQGEIKKVERDIQPVNVLVSNPLTHITTDSKLTNWAASFLAALSQCADMQFIEGWIKANLQLIERGEKPDRLFKSYVSCEASHAILDYGFAFVFLHTRASQAQLALFQELSSSPKAFAVTKARLKDFLLESFAASPDVVTAARKLKVNRTTVFGIGLSVAKAMDETILRAKRPLLKRELLHTSSDGGVPSESL